MTVDLVQALIGPPVTLIQLMLGFAWPAALVVSGFVALIAGSLLALNHGTRAPRWLFLPLLLAHLQLLAWSMLGLPGWIVLILLQVAAIGWLVWKCREALVAGLLLGWFCLVYCGVSAWLVYVQL